jgi:hypothetical protein
MNLQHPDMNHPTFACHKGHLLLSSSPLQIHKAKENIAK